jgi:hypothetical protein
MHDDLATITSEQQFPSKNLGGFAFCRVIAREPFLKTMISKIHLALLSSSLLFAVPAFAQSSHQGHHSSTSSSSAPAGELVPVTEKDAAWLAQARKNYPLTTCVVSDEALGSMGEADDHIYRVKGKPDQLVRFCCSGCEEDFLADPAAHLKKIEQARKDGGKKSDTGAAKGHHQH